jgi:ABC-type multidrug transport system ATPase subunit
MVVSFLDKPRAELFDRVIFLKLGKIKFDGTFPEFEKWKSSGDEDKENVPASG